MKNSERSILDCTFITHNEAETQAIGKRLGAVLRGGDVVVLEGDLGAGKTQLAKGIARGLGVTRELTSPTFNLVLEYPLEQRELDESCAPQVLRHFDLYRLEAADQLDDLDYFGLIEETDAASVVEWGSLFPERMPLDYLMVQLIHSVADVQERTIVLRAEGPRAEALLARLEAAGEDEPHVS